MEYCKGRGDNVTEVKSARDEHVLTSCYFYYCGDKGEMAIFFAFQYESVFLCGMMLVYCHFMPNKKKTFIHPSHIPQEEMMNTK